MAKVGRPSKYKPEYCEEIIEFMKEGASLVEFAASIGVSKQSLLEWKSVHPEFSCAYRDAVSGAEAHWQKMGMEGIQRDEDGKQKLDTNLFKFLAASRFGWSEKTEVKQETETTIKIAYDPSKLGEEE